jgi:hypothetical protein
MAAVAHATPLSPAHLWTARILGGIALLFLTFDTVIKLILIQPVTESVLQLGYPVTLARTIGIIELVCLVTYLIPRTSVLGAVLWTGYLGGAIATHLRLGNPLLTHTLFPIYIALMLWGSLYLRDPRVRALLPFRTEA